MNNFELIQPDTKQVSFQLEQAYNLFLSCLLLNKEINGLGDWVYETQKKLTTKEKKENKFLASSALLLLNKNWASFEDWLNFYRNNSSKFIINQELSAYNHEYFIATGSRVDNNNLLENEIYFLNSIESIFDYTGQNFDIDHFKQVWKSYQKPEERKNRIVEHFSSMWEKYLKEEWEREEPFLKDSINAYESIYDTKANNTDEIREILDRSSLSPFVRKSIDHAQKVILIPSMHIGPYLGFFSNGGEITRLVTGARIPQGAKVNSPALSRSELLMRLTALADDNRLRILELAAAKREITTQDVIDEIGLSQSSASRHLNQLTATGFLTVQPTERIKRYTIVWERFHITFQVLSEYLKHS